MTAPRHPIRTSGGERRMRQRPALKGPQGCRGLVRTGTLAYRLGRLPKGHEGGHE